MGFLRYEMQFSVLSSSILSKYKKLRNQVKSNIRTETKDFNNNRIDKAQDENEIWKVAKEITKPAGNPVNCSLISEGKLIEDPLQVANIFNDYFVDKIAALKNNIVELC